ncbi:uncharacterized protein LOC103961868 [Pyrus x bretschneideri]|uniref:uncharacterized protein LOC103961868 n=1 Tax=Pyrus x bretschneideri TaxID=225117 RepID=UPI00202EB576|nr:uncharacterized protein LOC103961868 [Pyrus x bretschneideri]
MWVVLGNAISASKLLNLQTPEKADSVLALLRSHGFSQLQISKENPFDKAQVFRLGWSLKGGPCKNCGRQSLSFGSSLEKRIVPTYNFLRSLLSEKNVIGVFKRRSWIFLVDHCKDVVPNIGLLRELGMPQPSISLLLAHYTHVAMNKHKRFGKIVGEVKEMGFSLRTSTFVFALHTLCGKSSKLIWKRSRKIFMSWGWSEDDFLSAFRKNPEFTIVSEKKLVQVMDFLVNKMGWASGMIARYPWVMRHSLEKSIRPRSLVVKVLRLKGLIDENLSLGYVMHPQDRLLVERFVTKFQIEVPQLWNVYHEVTGTVFTKEEDRVGLGRKGL